MSIASLRRRAADNTLEVEHLLKAASRRVPGLQNELLRLAGELAWSDEIYLPDGSHVVPLARWARVAGAFAEDGYGSLAPFSLDASYAPYILGLLEEINTPEAIDQLFVLFQDVVREPQNRPGIAHKLVSTINLLFSVKRSPISTSQQRDQAATFLGKVIPFSATNTERAHVLYALRGTGNSHSLEALEAVEEPTTPYAGARAMAIRAIRKRLASAGLQPGAWS